MEGLQYTTGSIFGPTTKVSFEVRDLQHRTWVDYVIGTSPKDRPSGLHDTLRKSKTVIPINAKRVYCDTRTSEPNARVLCNCPSAILDTEG